MSHLLTANTRSRHWQPTIPRTLQRGHHAHRTLLARSIPHIPTPTQSPHLPHSLRRQPLHPTQSPHQTIFTHHQASPSRFLRKSSGNRDRGRRSSKPTNTNRHFPTPNPSLADPRHPVSRKLIRPAVQAPHTSTILISPTHGRSHFTGIGTAIRDKRSLEDTLCCSAAALQKKSEQP